MSGRKEIAKLGKEEEFFSQAGAIADAHTEAGIDSLADEFEVTRDRLRALYLHMGAEIGDPDFNTFEGHSALLVKEKGSPAAARVIQSLGILQREADILYVMGAYGLSEEKAIQDLDNLPVAAAERGAVQEVVADEFPESY